MVKNLFFYENSTKFDLVCELLYSHEWLVLWHNFFGPLYIMWPIHLQGLRLLRPTVKEEMHYKKIHYSTFDLVAQNVAQYPLHHVTYSPARFEVATSNR